MKGATTGFTTNPRIHDIRSFVKVFSETIMAAAAKVSYHAMFCMGGSKGKGKKGKEAMSEDSPINSDLPWDEDEGNKD
ncbi:hypothetical protein BPAE_0065g00030 [Botrytis paeoniae]|uniref:Uncharacterized protein n=1 Tax=Botrytis paeoniae TaxID=278948 RepID=A0A4Z1FT70_9HELO|nr:hypothetical protein BPAE_0065g00030 [Botrytis paeoniae]